MSAIRPANAPDMPARQDPPSLPLPGVALWHPRTRRTPTDDELNEIEMAKDEAEAEREEADAAAAAKWRRWRELQSLWFDALDRVRADGDEVVRVEVKP